MSYDEAVKSLQSQGQRDPVGRRFRRHRRDAAHARICDRPVMVDRYPAAVKAFYFAAGSGAAGSGAGRRRARAGRLRRNHRRRPAHPRSRPAAEAPRGAQAAARSLRLVPRSAQVRQRAARAASAWASSAAWPGCAAWSTSARPSRSRACCTGCGRKFCMRQSHIAIIGAPLDLGAGRRGVDMGPSALRVANLNKRVASLGYEVEDLGNVPVEQPESLPEGPRAREYLPQIAATCARLARHGGAGCWTRAKCPLVLGGDHSIAIGTVAGMSRHFRKQQQKARADLDRRARRHEHAGDHAQRQCARHAAGLLHRPGSRRTDRACSATRRRSMPRNVAMVGLRDVDDARAAERARDAACSAFTMRDIDERGLRAVMEEAIAHRDRRAPPAFIFRSIWTPSIPQKRPASARRCAAASPIARRTWPWK